MSTPEIERARVLCRNCPVQRACLEYGLSEDWGVWGGYTRAERARAMVSVEGDPDLVLVAFDAGTLDEISLLP